MRTGTERHMRACAEVGVFLRGSGICWDWCLGGIAEGDGQARLDTSQWREQSWGFTSTPSLRSVCYTLL